MRKLSSILLVVVLLLLLQTAPLANRGTAKLGRWLTKPSPFEPTWPRSSIVAYDVAHLKVGDQLWDLAYALHFACKTGTFVSISSVLLDFESGQRGQLEDFIDIEATNQKLNCTRIVPWRKVETSLHHITGSPEWLHDAWDRNELAAGRDVMLTRLVYARSLRWQTGDGAKLPSRYYAIHLGLETDLIVHECTSYELYLQWLVASRSKANAEKAAQIAHEVMSRPQTRWFVEQLMDEYHEHVARLFVNKQLPIVIATTLAWQRTSDGPASIEAELLNVSVSDLRPRRVLIGQSASPRREVNAAADLVVMTNAEAFVGFSTSIFSRIVGIQLGARDIPYALTAGAIDCM